MRSERLGLHWPADSTGGEAWAARGGGKEGCARRARTGGQVAVNRSGRMVAPTWDIQVCDSSMQQADADPLEATRKLP